MISSRRRRVLIAPREIAGVAAGLQRGLHREGLDADVLLRWPHPFGYRHDTSRSFVLRVLAWLILEPYDEPAGRLRRSASLAGRAVLACLVPFRYSAVVFLGPDTLFRGGHDRRWFTRSGVQTVTVFLGSEARPPYMDGYFARSDSPDVLEAVRLRTEEVRARVRRAERDSTYVVNHPGTGQFHSRPFVDWTMLGYPSVDVAAAAQPARLRFPSRTVVLHAPSDPQLKGTDRIREAIGRLSASGLDVDYVEVSGRPHEEVLDAIRNADLVVDQLYSDVLLPGLATEAARLGTPVIVFGYAGAMTEPIAERVGMPMDHYDHPDNLDGVVERLVRDGSARVDLGVVLQRCMNGVWSADEIAHRWARLVTGHPDVRWMDQPDSAPYPYGCAIELARLVAFLERYVGAFGAGALGLDDAPRTRSAVLELAGTGQDET